MEKDDDEDINSQFSSEDEEGLDIGFDNFDIYKYIERYQYCDDSYNEEDMKVFMEENKHVKRFINPHDEYDIDAYYDFYFEHRYCYEPKVYNNQYKSENDEELYKEILDEFDKELDREKLDEFDKELNKEILDEFDKEDKSKNDIQK